MYPVAQFTFQKAVGFICFVAFASLLVQADVLFSAKGLWPAAEFARVVNDGGVSWLDAPSWLRVLNSDRAVAGGAFAGVVLSLLVLLDMWPRFALAAMIPLYLGFVVAGGPFFAFQWDSLLIETLTLTVFMSVTRKQPLMVLLLRLLLVKLYVESGLAKLQSPLGDWLNGDAMVNYFQTAPLPAWPAWFAYNLPSVFLRLAGWLVLLIELVVPWGLLGTPFTRFLAFWLLTGFQIANIATANYGFFVYLTLALHILALDDETITAWTRRASPVPVTRTRIRVVTERDWKPVPARTQRRDRAVALHLIVFWAGFSLIEAGAWFGRSPEFARLGGTPRALYAPARLVNNYHLFSAITTERIEPTVEVDDGNGYEALEFRFKPGPPGRAPPFVAPHQPRVDFLLWFYGLAYQQPAPVWAERILERLCTSPKTMRPLFMESPKRAPARARLAFDRYQFTNYAQGAESGHYWLRRRVGVGIERNCRAGGAVEGVGVPVAPGSVVPPAPGAGDPATNKRTRGSGAKRVRRNGASGADKP